MKGVEQGSLNSTLSWSTTSSWESNGDIDLFGDLRLVEFWSEGYLGASFATTSTNYANQNYMEYPLVGCPGDRISVDLCDERATCHGYTSHIRLYTGYGKSLRSDDDSCGLCSSLSYQVPYSVTECVNYTARLVCYWGPSCSTAPWISINRISSSNQVPSLKSWKIRETLAYGDNQYHTTSFLSLGDTETLSASGNGQYSVQSGYDW
jgi:hypothetical protein